jgi:hypothetical protein
MQTGDLIFFKGSSLISKIIAKLTKSPYTHVVIALDEYRVLEADRFIKSRIVTMSVDLEVHHVYRARDMNQKHAEAIMTLIQSHEGYSYDYSQIFKWFVYLTTGWSVPLTNRANKLFCSEVVDYILFYSDLPRNPTYPLGDLLPPMLIKAYDLQPVD